MSAGPGRTEETGSGLVSVHQHVAAPREVSRLNRCDEETGSGLVSIEFNPLTVTNAQVAQYANYYFGKNKGVRTH